MKQALDTMFKIAGVITLCIAHPREAISLYNVGYKTGFDKATRAMQETLNTIRAEQRQREREEKQ